jgi:outer membrane protein OmpA-like peptidoglycan-associated protein
MTRTSLTGLCLTALLGFGIQAGGGAAPALAQTEPTNPGIAIPNVTGAERNSDEIIEMLSPRQRGIRLHAGEEEAPMPSREEGMGQLSASFDSILFELNSAQILPGAIPTLNAIGQALSSQELAAYRFGVYGHTDASGEAAYNDDLSQRRALAVRTYLIDKFGIEPSRLQARGFGETRLKDPSNPRSSANRRVELVNLDS